MSDIVEGRCAEVALALPIYNTYCYNIPKNLEAKLQLGIRLLVQVGSRIVTGYYLGTFEYTEEEPLSDIIDVLEERSLFDERMLEFLLFTADYLFYPIGEVFRGALPSGINIESRLAATITEKGKIFYEANFIQGLQGEVLKDLIGGQSKFLKELMNLHEGLGRTQLKEMEKEGLITIRNDLLKPRMKKKKVRFYTAVEGFSLAQQELLLKRSKKQRELLGLLKEHGTLSALELKELYAGNTTSILRELMKKGLVSVEEKEVSTNPFFAPLEERYRKEAPSLTEAQKSVIEAVLPKLEKGEFQSFLLHGVTGSGKTEVYMRLIERTIALGKQAIVLVPEISLTPQFVANFRGRLGDSMALLHSALTQRERFEQWQSIYEQKVSFVIGARSAIFAPLRNVGIIIVDEEQETSYKQEGHFPYNARDLALVRGKIWDATVILGSATPALESFHKARIGKWGYLSLPERVTGHGLPKVEVIDLRQVKKRERGVFSRRLLEAIRATLSAGKQAMLFVNRRGYHSSFVCSSCGHDFRCPHCSVTLTYHRGQGLLVCHYCGYNENFPRVCPQCRSSELERLGWGTERLEEIVRELFPEARVVRMDRDTTSGRGRLEDIIEKFGRGDYDILIGTQMIAKGHDFPGVKLVGVLLADMGLNIPDFRSAERTFQLLTQVAGRAGRGEELGQVLIQTFNPEHPSIRFAMKHDYLSFYRVEIERRKKLGYPPFSWLIAMRFEGKDAERTRDIALEVREVALKLVEREEFQRVLLAGPVLAPIERIKKHFRWQMFFKSDVRSQLHQFLWQLIDERGFSMRKKGVKIFIDVDPMQML